MKTNCWLLLGTMLATSAVAQVNTNALPEIPAPATTVAPATPAVPSAAPATEAKTNAVKKAVHKKKAVKKAATKSAKEAGVKEAGAKETGKKKSEKAETPAVPALPVVLVPGPATVAAEHVNLRGQAGLKGEVVGHVQKGETINVISEITLDKPKAGEPAQWAKVSLPASAKVWVDSKYIDPTNKVVTARKLNLRGGPGENFSVLGVIEKGTTVTPMATKENWTQIETPSNAFAFVAATLLKQEPGATPMTSTPPVASETVPPTPAPTPTPTPVPAVPPTPTTVAETPAIAPPAATPPTPEPALAPPPVQVTPPVAVTPPPVVPTPTLAPEDTNNVDTNLPPRIVTHEGSVRRSVSPVAPTYFELYDPSTDKAVNYLYTTSTNLVLSRYDGLHIAVTGEEGLDSRWRDTPVLTIQKIYVISGTPKPEPAPAPAGMKPVKKHWWQKK
ncbi:MAG TPA: SH3 domain-containing protein [Verrucomicrobiae bacterium]